MHSKDKPVKFREASIVKLVQEHTDLLLLASKAFVYSSKLMAFSKQHHESGIEHAAYRGEDGRGMADYFEDMTNALMSADAVIRAPDAPEASVSKVVH